MYDWWRLTVWKIHSTSAFNVAVGEKELNAVWLEVGTEDFARADILVVVTAKQEVALANDSMGIVLLWVPA